MTKHIQFTDNILSGRYDSFINTVIPKDAIEVTDEVFFQTINETDGIWSLVNGEIIKQPLPAVMPQPPASVSMRSARLALLGIGKLAEVNAAISGMTGAEGEAARIEWEYATEVNRNSVLTQSLAGALGLTEAMLDDLFFAAAAL